MTATAKIKFSPLNQEARRGLDMRSGDTVKVWSRIKEGDKTRLQAYEGMIIARKHGAEPGATFTVRRVAGGFGVERIFPLYSPNIEKIELLKRSKARRAKLYYIRDKAAKEIRRKMKQLTIKIGKPELPSEIAESTEPIAEGTAVQTETQAQE